MRTKISVIGIVGVPASYGGFETFADYLCNYINDKFDLTVYCSGKSYKTKSDSYQKAKLKYIPLKATGIQSIPYDIWSILASLRHSDVLLVLGSSGAIILPFVKTFTKKKIVFNMAGLEWKRSKWHKLARKFLKWSEKIAIKYSDVVVVDNKGLQEYIFNEYAVKSEVIAYGGEQAVTIPLSRNVLEKYSFLNNSYYCAVARIQSDNNIDIILEAFKEHSQEQLVFIGNWGFSEYGRNLKRIYSDVSNIELLDPIYDLDILNQIRSNCKGYIHGHSSGGTNPSLVEAMHLEVPIVAFDVNFNRYTTHDEAFYFSNKKDLIGYLDSELGEECKLSARKMKIIAEKHYTWRAIVNMYERLF